MDPGFRLLSPAFGLCLLQHLLAEVQADHVGALPSQSERQIARAAAQVERALTGLRIGHFEDTAFPISVQAKTLEIVDQVITRSDEAEQVVDLRSALAARLKEWVAHTEMNLNKRSWNVFCCQSRPWTALRPLGLSDSGTGL